MAFPEAVEDDQRGTLAKHLVVIALLEHQLGYPLGSAWVHPLDMIYPTPYFHGVGIVLSY